MSEEELFSEMKVILSTVAKGDALKIFNFAKDGIFNSSHTIKELGLSQKRYYSRLKELIEAGLIEKRDGTYHHTMLGSACHQLGKVFVNVLSQRDHLDLLTRLKGAKSLSSTERREFAETLRLKELDPVANLLRPLRMIEDYEDLVQETMSLLEKAESEVHFATQYFDAQVVEELLRGIKRDVNFTFLYDFKGSLYTRASLIMKVLFSSPKILSFFYEWLKSKKLRMRVLELPYTFLIVDGKYALVELKGHEDAFSLAFIFESPILCRKLIKYFNVLWNRGSDFDLKQSLVDSLESEDHENKSSNEKVKPDLLLKRDGEASKNHRNSRHYPGDIDR